MTSTPYQNQNLSLETPRGPVTLPTNGWSFAIESTITTAPHTRLISAPTRSSTTDAPTEVGRKITFLGSVCSLAASPRMEAQSLMVGSLLSRSPILPCTHRFGAGRDPSAALR